ncbi:MAG: tryptophan synthase subunit alpha [Actinomycetota bacterium]|nr:tryptophan synthase subunit alpha [Actinomycetota bacterium]
MGSMDGRLGRMFSEVRAEGRAALITYTTAFYPDRQTSISVMLTMLESGADALEIGLPFSDPVMDGPTIEEASKIALSSGATPQGVLELAASLRQATPKPILIMSYYNPIFHHGVKRFVRTAKEAGVDALVVPDLPAEEMFPLREACERACLETVSFCSPTTSDSRIAACAEAASGFIYCVSRLGTTGTREGLSADLAPFIQRIRAITTKPLAVGIGISTPEQCREVGKLADGAIVGSALVKEIPGFEPARKRESALAALVSALSDSLRG